MVIYWSVKLRLRCQIKWKSSKCKEKWSENFLFNSHPALPLHLELRRAQQRLLRVRPDQLRHREAESCCSSCCEGIAGNRECLCKSQTQSNMKGFFKSNNYMLQFDLQGLHHREISFVIYTHITAGWIVVSLSFYRKNSC